MPTVPELPADSVPTVSSSLDYFASQQATTYTIGGKYIRVTQLRSSATETQTFRVGAEDGFI